MIDRICDDDRFHGTWSSTFQIPPFRCLAQLMRHRLGAGHPPHYRPIYLPVSALVSCFGLHCVAFLPQLPLWMVTKGDRMRIILPFCQSSETETDTAAAVRPQRRMDANHSAKPPNQDSMVPEDVYVAVTSVTGSGQETPMTYPHFLLSFVHIFKRTFILKFGFHINCPLLPTLPCSSRFGGRPTTKSGGRDPHFHIGLGAASAENATRTGGKSRNPSVL